MTLGVYGTAYLTSLEEHRPAEYARAKAAGTLHRDAQAVETRAQAQFQNTLAALRKQQPDPADYPSRVQHHLTLESMARELVMDDAVVRPPNEPAAMPDTSPVATTS